MKTILVVDDQERIRRVYSKIFQREGYAVFDAGEIAHADRILRANQIDLMLLDIKIPEINGVDYYNIISLFGRKPKIIVSSVYPLDDQKSFIKNADDYFDKSEGINVLKIKVKKLLGGPK